MTKVTGGATVCRLEIGVQQIENLRYGTSAGVLAERAFILCAYRNQRETDHPPR